MEFKNTAVFNIGGALRGMRNPHNSWKYIDSSFGLADLRTVDEILEESYIDDSITFDDWKNNMLLQTDSDLVEYAIIGPKDLTLAQKLIKAGPEHRKFLRQIFVSVDIVAPLYFFKEFDTYKIGTSANSTSTMHKLASTPITLDCFETEGYDYNLPIDIDAANGTDEKISMAWGDFVECDLIPFLEKLRQTYLATNDKGYWKELIRWLPESWLQTRTWTANYEVLRTMYFQRKAHKLTEWDAFCEWVESLPYAKELITYNG